MLQTYSFSGSRPINTKARFFRYVSGDAGGADASIVLRINGATIGTYSPGDSVTLDDAYSQWSIEPVTGSCVGTVVMGMGSVASSTFSGSVSMAMQGAFSQGVETVTNASAQLVGANPARRYLLIVNNDGAGVVYLNLAGNPATANSASIKLNPTESLEMPNWCPTQAIFAIGSISNNPNVLVVEG